MTLPTTTTLNGCDDDSDMFGPPRSSPPIGYRSRVPMISPKLRQREERKRILQLCAHKLERIKDSETNLRRSVCINNTYCRLTDELRREKQSRYLANLPKSESLPETARDNIFNPYNSCGIDSSDHQPSNKNSLYASNNNSLSNHGSINDNDSNVISTVNHNNNIVLSLTSLDDNDDHIDVVHHDDDDDDNDNDDDDHHALYQQNIPTIINNNNNNNNQHHNNRHNVNEDDDNDDNNNNKKKNLVDIITSTSSITTTTTTSSTTITSSSSTTTTTTASGITTTSSSIATGTATTTPLDNNTSSSLSSTIKSTSSSSSYKRHYHHHNSSNTLDTDLEILDRELNAINSPLLIDPEITQGAEQLEKALLSSSSSLSSTRKRGRVEDESDRLVREALSQFYIPPQRLISAIEDCPLDLMSASNALAMSGHGVNMTMNGFGLTSMMHMGHHHQHHNHNHNLGHHHKRARLDMPDINNINHYQHNANSTTTNHNNGNNNLNNNNNVVVNDLELDFDMNPNQKDFEVIMDALRLGTPSPTNSSDSCGQAAMMLSESASVFHNLVVTSLET